MASSQYATGTTAALQNLRVDSDPIPCSSQGRNAQQKRLAPSTQGPERQGRVEGGAVCTTQETVGTDTRGATAMTVM